MNADPSSSTGQPPTRLTTFIWASAMGMYLLVAVGGITTLLDGGGACSSWPTCGPGFIGTKSDPAVIVVLGHRLASLVVGLLLLVTLGLAWRHRRGRTSATVLLVTLLYPVQIGIGAMTATRETAMLSTLHLALGIAIFSLTLLALLWHLEHTSATAPETTPSVSRTVSQEMASASETATSKLESERADRNAVHRTTPSGFAPGIRDRMGAYLQLTKPRLMWLLCLLAVAAMALAAGPNLTGRTVVATSIGGMLAVGASGTFNNVLERDVDRRMNRTADRPLVQGRVPVRRAATFGLLLAGLSVVVFVVFVNVLAALLGVVAILFYSVVYTLVLKPHTRQNIVLGGAVGAFPALIGWAAVENAIGAPAVVLGAVVFLWTPAHFYNLALAYRDDYAQAGFPMLPVVRGGATTRRHILLYLGATLIGSVILGVTTRLEWVYATTIVLVGGMFLWTTLGLFRERTEDTAFRTFHASNAYLGCLLLAIVVDMLVV